MKNNTVNWDFIKTLEGWETKGYVPKDLDGDNSGVTIAAGFDIGQHSKAQIKAFKFPLSLEDKLVLYAGLKGSSARIKLQTHPLKLTNEELTLLDHTVKEYYYRKVQKEYNENSDFNLEFLSTEQQTVIVSVAFQYGSLKRCPRFFKFVTKGQWKCVIAELENFGDAYIKRRNKEAAYLRSGMKIEGKLTKC